MYLSAGYMLHAASFIFRKSSLGPPYCSDARTFGLRDVNVARITHTYIHSLICTSYFLLKYAVVVDNTILYPMLFLTLSH